MSEQEIDFETDAEVKQDPASLHALRDIYQRYKKFCEVLAKLEQSIKEVKSSILDIEMKTIPDILNELKLTRFDTDDGLIITKERWVSVSMPTRVQIDKEKDPDKRIDMLERQKECLDWIIEQGGEAIIADMVSIDLGKGGAEKRDKIVEFAEELELYATCDKAIHHSTLKSFVKEKITAGINVPIKPFSLVDGDKAKFKKKK
jgi:hypothetical protein